MFKTVSQVIGVGMFFGGTLLCVGFVGYYIVNFIVTMIQFMTGWK